MTQPIDRASLVAFLRTQAAWGPTHCELVADRILALVEPAPIHDELHAEIARANRAEARLARINDLCNDAGYAGLPSNLVAKIRAVLGDPVPGITLTPEEAALARAWYTRLPIGVAPEDVALARRLQEAS